MLCKKNDLRGHTSSLHEKWLILIHNALTNLSQKRWVALVEVLRRAWYQDFKTLSKFYVVNSWSSKIDSVEVQKSLIFESPIKYFDI